jgi:hypothetical protein
MQQLHPYATTNKSEGTPDNLRLCPIVSTQLPQQGQSIPELANLRY